MCQKSATMQVSVIVMAMTDIRLANLHAFAMPRPPSSKEPIELPMRVLLASCRPAAYMKSVVLITAQIDWAACSSTLIHPDIIMRIWKAQPSAQYITIEGKLIV